MTPGHVPAPLGSVPRARMLVGRDVVLDRLHGFVAGAAGGGGRLVVVTGEAGIGKTRLCEEVAASARDDGFDVCWAACAEFAGYPAFWPWSQFLTQMGRSMPRSEPPADLAQEAEAARLAVFEATVDVLRQASASRPRLLVLDDLQWADDATVRLLAYVAPVLRNLPVLILSTLRSDDRGDERSQVGDIERQSVVVPLDGLHEAHVRQLVQQGSAHPVSEQATRAIHVLTGGNPLFTLELVARLESTDALEAFAAGQIPEVPRTVRAAQAGRLERISAECRAALDMAAVVGTEFDLGLLGHVLGLGSPEVLALVDEAATAGLVREVGAGRLAFTHPLLAGTIYEELGVARRVRAHERVGLAIESSPRGRRDVAALAHHFLAAAPGGTAERAVHYSTEAAAAAMTTLAYADAARLYERALAALTLAPASGDRVALLIALAEARAADGLPSSRDALLEAARHAREEHRPEDLAAVALGLAGGRGFEVGLFDDTQIALLEEALAKLPDAALAIRSLCSSRLSVALSLSDEENRRAELSEAAIDLARRARDPAALAHALAASCDVHAGPAWTGHRLRAADEIIGTARAARDPYAELLGRRLRLVALLETGDLAGAEAEVGRFARTADRLGQAVHGWYVPLWRAMLATARGSLEEAQRLADDAWRIGLQAHSTNAGLLVMGLRFFLRREAGDVTEMLDELDRALLEGPGQDLGVMAAGTIALARAAAGRADEAADLLDRIGDELRDLTEDSEWLPLLAQVAETVWELGGHSTAGWLYGAMLPHEASWTVEGIGAYVHGSLARHLGLLASLLGRSDDARRHFETALEANRRAGAHLLVARTLWDGGAALGDERWIRDGLQAYRALGLERRAAQLEETEARVIPASGIPGAATSAGQTVPVLDQQGDVWLLEFDNTVAHVHESKGVRDLARLLAVPGREIAALDLAAGPTSPVGAPAEGLAVQGDLGEVIDAPARAAYKARLAELETELDEADGDGDASRSERLVAERDALLAQLAGAYGLHGRPRRAGDPAERARTAVTSRIRDAIRRIEKVHPSLGRHLARSVRTGTFCVYDP